MKKTIKNVLALVFVLLMAAGSLSTFRSGRWTEVTEPEASPEATEAVEAPESMEATAELKTTAAAATTAPVATQQPAATPTPGAATPTPQPTEKPSTPQPTEKPSTPQPTQKPAETPKPSTPSPAPTEQPKPTPKPSTPTPSPKPSEAPSHTHNWTEVTKTVHHDAVTEQVWIVDKPAWTESTGAYNEWFCQCGFRTTNPAENDAHVGQYFKDPAHESGGVNCYPGQTINHPEEGHWETRVTKEAWDETVVTGYKCSCGATK